MNSIKRMVPQNSIIRRVRRHTAMATLFRSADPTRLGFYPGSRPTPTPGLTGQAGVSFAASASQPSAEVAEAILLPASSSLPVGHVIGTPSVTEAATFSMGYPMQRTPVPPTAVEPTPARAPEARPSPTTLRQAQDTAPPETGSKTENAVWRRLQTIFRKHQDKQAAEEMTSESEIPSTPTQRDPAPEKMPTIQQETIQPKQQESQRRPRPAPARERRRPEQTDVPQTPGATEMPPTAQVHKKSSPRSAMRVGPETVPSKRLESQPPTSGPGGAEEARKTGAPQADTPLPQEPTAGRSVQELITSQAAAISVPPIPGSPPEKTHESDLVERFSVEQPHRRAQSDEGYKPAAEVETSVPQLSTGPDMEETVERTAIMGEPEMIPVPEAEAPDRTPPESFVQLQAEIGESPQQASHRSVVRPFDEAQGRPRSPQKEGVSEGDVFHTDTLEPTTLADVTKTSTSPFVEAEEGTLLSESQGQPLPLQAVWPVQRLEEPTLSPSPEPPAMSTSVSTSASEPEPLEPVRDKAPETAEIRKALRDVAPGQPTDSSIEIIPPRRPRPASPESFDIAQDKLRRRVEGLRPEPAWPERSRRVEGPRPVAPPSGRQPLAEPGTAPRSPGEATSRSSPVQMRPDGGSDAAQSRTPEEGLQEPRLVQTEIGSLPTDLWHLLGQSPPRQSPHGVEPEPATSRPAPPTTDGEAAAKRAVAAAEARPVPPASPTSEQSATQGGAPSVIQRRPDEAGVDTGSAAGAEAGGAETETAAPPGERGAAEEPDVDELARRVYAEIKRRLSVEWERVRRRE